MLYKYTVIYQVYRPNKFLANVPYVQIQDNVSIVQSLYSVVGKYAINWNQVVAIVTDNARKNIKGFEIFKKHLIIR